MELRLKPSVRRVSSVLGAWRLRHSVLGAAVGLLTACASGGSATGASSPDGSSMRTLTTTDAGSIQTVTDVSERFAISAPVEKVFAALTPALRDVGIEPTTIDPAAHQVGNPGFQKTGKLGSASMTDYFDCGGDMTGLRASRDRMTISIMLTVTPAAAGSSDVRAQIRATSRNMMGTSSDAIQCGSSGRLEGAIKAATERHLATP
jgi:hypothetical protein